ncbi:DinB family protein [Paenibacillus sp. 2TAB26]|uniref:DinB family protein n=1 Tax=Paenibacillus sp. 2TAB26 TaxID=3233005 RepID=UPI003F94EEAE
MIKQNELIQQFGSLAPWYSSLSHITPEPAWLNPIKEGKWSAAEIIAHLDRWDQYFITSVLLEAEKNSNVEFPNHDEYNAASSAYALSGILPSEILNQAIETRQKLVQKLTEMTEQQFFHPITVHGNTHCPQTKAPYSIGYLIFDFIQHDEHHRKQVEEFLLQPQSKK